MTRNSPQTGRIERKQRWKQRTHLFVDFLIYWLSAELFCDVPFLVNIQLLPFIGIGLQGL